MAQQVYNMANNSLASRAQTAAAADFDDRGKKFTSFINGNAIKNLLTQSLGGPQQAAQMTSTLISVVSQNEKLQLAPPMQILAGALRGEIGMGLSLVLGDYSIIPYENRKEGTVTAQFQLQVNGIKRMCIASGAYEKINCYDVRDGEFRGYDQDTWEPIVVRNPNDEEREQLPIVGYYAFYKLSKAYNGFTSKVYWPYGKILRHADRYSKAFDLSIWEAIQSGAKSGTDKWGKTWYADRKREGTPWYGDTTDEGHMKMCKKTVLKQLLSDGFAPKSTIIQNAIAIDNAAEASDEPVTYSDEYERMAQQAAFAAAEEAITAPQTQNAPAIPAAPESIAQPVVEAPRPVEAPVPAQTPAPAPAKRGRPSKAQNAAKSEPQTLPAEQPPVSNVSVVEPDYPGTARYGNVSLPPMMDFPDMRVPPLPDDPDDDIF